MTFLKDEEYLYVLDDYVRIKSKEDIIRGSTSLQAGMTEVSYTNINGSSDPIHFAASMFQYVGLIAKVVLVDQYIYGDKAYARYTLKDIPFGYSWSHEMLESVETSTELRDKLNGGVFNEDAI